MSGTNNAKDWEVIGTNPSGLTQKGEKFIALLEEVGSMT